MVFWGLSSSVDKSIHSIFNGGSIYYIFFSFLFLRLMLRKYKKRWNTRSTFGGSKLLYLFSSSYIFWAPNFFENAWSISHDPFSILVSFSRQWKQDLTWPDPKILTRGRTGLSKVGQGHDFNICLKTRMGAHTPPHLGFGTEMENNYIFWD